MAETELEKPKTPSLEQISAQLWAAFGAAAGIQIELEVYNRSVKMGQLTNVKNRIANFANELYHEQALSCATQAGNIAAKVTREQGLVRVTADIFEQAAEEVRISQLGTGGGTAQPRGGIC